MLSGCLSSLGSKRQPLPAAGQEYPVSPLSHKFSHIFEHASKALNQPDLREASLPWMLPHISGPFTALENKKSEHLRAVSSLKTTAGHLQTGSCMIALSALGKN